MKIGMNKDAFTDPDLLFRLQKLQKGIEEKSDNIMTSLNSELVQACPVSNVPPQKKLRLQTCLKCRNLKMQGKSNQERDSKIK